MNGEREGERESGSRSRYEQWGSGDVLAAYNGPRNGRIVLLSRRINERELASTEIGETAGAASTLIIAIPKCNGKFMRRTIRQRTLSSDRDLIYSAFMTEALTEDNAAGVFPERGSRDGCEGLMDVEWIAQWRARWQRDRMIHASQTGRREDDEGDKGSDRYSAKNNSDERAR